MASGFRRSLTGRISGRLDAVERGLLRTLVEQLTELVAPPQAPAADPLAVELGLEDLDTSASDLGLLEDRDPVLDRLFPPGYSDPAEALEFRRFTELSLRQQKVASAAIVHGMLDDGDKITLTPGEAQAWLTTLNDIRLALSVRLGIESAADQERLQALTEGDDLFELFTVYDFCTYLQDSLIRAMSG
ncbi:MAG: DUF2017 domain-containing protein [Actinobacteria bacterium]|mgnify:CR=1 FL=1|nr:DUF2017 domain-containing protein [Actinomycetota bacterium]